MKPACDGCGRELDETTGSINEVDTPDGSRAYICDDCHESYSDDPDSLF